MLVGRCSDHVADYRHWSLGEAAARPVVYHKLVK